MFKKIVISLILVASSLFGTQVNWAKDYQSGIKRAMAENKPVFFIMSKTTCPPCIRLKKTTFIDAKVVKMLDENFVSIMANVDRDDYIPKVLQAPYTPSIWFLKSNGEPKYEPLVGYVNAESFLKALDIVKKDFDKSQVK